MAARINIALFGQTGRRSRVGTGPLFVLLPPTPDHQPACAVDGMSVLGV